MISTPCINLHRTAESSEVLIGSRITYSLLSGTKPLTSYSLDFERQSGMYIDMHGN